MYSSLYTIESGRLVARIIGRTTGSGRFRRAFLFVGDGPFPKRGILYSAVVHAATVILLLSSPIPVPQPADLLEAEFRGSYPLRTSESVSNISSPDIRRQAAAAMQRSVRQKFASRRCCGGQLIVSNPPNATNHVQTILQPDFADRAPLEKFVPLPDNVKLAPVSLGSASRIRTSDVSEPKSLERDLVAVSEPPVLPALALPVLRAPQPTPLSAAATTPALKDSKPSRERNSQGNGGDPRDILALSVIPAPPSDVLPIPMAESRGQFVLGTPLQQAAVAHRESGNAASSNVDAKSKATRLAQPEIQAIRGGARPASKPTAIPNSTPTHAANPFAGITIQGGEWNRQSRELQRSATGPHPDDLELGASPLTVAAAGNSGGGLRDFGVFSNQVVYTDYFTLERFKGPDAASFVLQFALDGPSNNAGASISPPRPKTEVPPNWPPETAAPYVGDVIVVYGVIAEDGKFHDAQVLESSCFDLNPALLDALAEWAFRPAAINGQPVAVKALLGVPVMPYQGDESDSRHREEAKR